MSDGVCARCEELRSFKIKTGTWKLLGRLIIVMVLVAVMGFFATGARRVTLR